MPSKALKPYLMSSRSRTPGVPTADFMVVITDGMANCVSCPVPNRPSPYRGEWAWGGPPTCADNLTYHLEQVMRIADLVGRYQGLRDLSIPVHVFMTGASAMPHTIDYNRGGVGLPGDPYQCITDAEWRSLPPASLGGNYSVSFTLWWNPNLSGTDNDSYDWDGRSAAQPYYHANQEMYRIARSTGGVWAPIRPRDTNCPDHRTSYYVPPCNLNKTTIRNDDTGADVPLSWLRSTDPYCRSVREQVEDYMADILRDSPYIVVEAE